MDSVLLRPAGSAGRDFVPAQYRDSSHADMEVRDAQLASLLGDVPRWRQLKSDEIATLVENGNRADDWFGVLVADPFAPHRVRNTTFHGLVRICSLQDAVLEHHDLQLSIGITNSRLVSCDIGPDVAIHNVAYMAHVVVGPRCILFNINELHTTNHAKFGNGILTHGESEDVRIWLDVMNESGTRRILPFDGMIPADAYLWAKYRDDAPLQAACIRMTEERFDARRGYYGTVGEQTVIKHCRILKDVKIGAHAYVKGANKLKNLTINSSAEEPTQIGEGVELVNGIVGYGCHIFYGCKAVRFVMGRNSNLKYGARLIHSFLGDNSTVSCCEVLNNLIFPAHEQHHNNSFLVASVVMGQSNIAAAATIGSNHNSRANDNEVQAGRGFWPGLTTSLKHSSRFASFVLLAKGDYPAELDIPLPFSLVNNNVHDNRLEIMPAYWWMYNMYALIRNAWKFHQRDSRVHPVQRIEFNALAPDTAEEMVNGLRLLERWTGQAAAPGGDDAELERGRGLLRGDLPWPERLLVFADGIEKSHRPVVILKPRDAYVAYCQMLLTYAVNRLMEYLDAQPGLTFTRAGVALDVPRETAWVNLGGQLVQERDVDTLRAMIGAGELAGWDQVHAHYHRLWDEYPLRTYEHAYGIIRDLLVGSPVLDGPGMPSWGTLLDRAQQLQQLVCDRVYESRRKDYDNPFKRVTFRNQEELDASVGAVEQNSFVRQVREETAEFARRAERLRGRS